VENFFFFWDNSVSPHIFYKAGLEAVVG